MWRFITILIYSPPRSPLFSDGLIFAHPVHCPVVMGRRGEMLVGQNKEVNRFPTDTENTLDRHLN